MAVSHERELALLRDALRRVVRIREGLEDGDLRYVAQIAEDFELDLVGAVVRLEEAA